MAKRSLHLNLFIFACGHHRAAWRHPQSAVHRIGDIAYIEELAQTAERGKFDAIFLADGHTVQDVQNGPRWFLEPLTTLAAVSRNTQHIGLISTVSSTFGNPFHTARMLSSLDHISGGRMGWNVVTSMFDAEARNHGFAAMPDHANRYARAEEFIDVVLRLWDSWSDQALRPCRSGHYADPAEVRPIMHEGAFFRVDGPLTIPRSPQGHPVLIQAGASEPGRALAARHAEAIYAVAYDFDAARSYYTDIHRRAQALGRNAPLILPGLVSYVASTEAEAKAKQRELDEYLPTETSLRQLESFILQDCSDWVLDAPPPPLPSLEAFTGPKGRYGTILRIIETERPTVRGLLGRLAAGGGHCTVVGTPDQVADHIEYWYRHGAADGFNLMPPALPSSLEDFVDTVVPVLQARGLFRRDYEHHTLRAHLGLARPSA